MPDFHKRVQAVSRPADVEAAPAGDEALLVSLKRWDADRFAESLNETLMRLVDARKLVSGLYALLMSKPNATLGHSADFLKPPSSNGGVHGGPSTPSTPVRPATSALGEHRMDAFWKRVDSAIFAEMPAAFEQGLMAFVDLRFRQHQRLQRLRKRSRATPAAANRSRRRVGTDESPGGSGDDDEKVAEGSDGEGSSAGSADGESSSDEDSESDDEEVTSASQADLEATMQAFRETGTRLREAQWGRFAERPIFDVVFARIEARLQSLCADYFESPQLATAVSWVKGTVLPWLETIMGPASSVDFAGDLRSTPLSLFASKSNTPVQNDGDPNAPRQFVRGDARRPGRKSEQKSRGAGSIWRQRALLFTYQSFARMRIGEIFELLREFPNSRPALVDLREALVKTGQHDELVSTLQTTISKRLLIPGANTRDILKMYSSTIRALPVLDPARIVLKSIGPRFCEYLRSRADTVRCIVDSLIESNEDGAGADGLAELAAELEAEKEPGAQHSDDERGDGLDWEPDALYAGGSRLRGTEPKSDIIEMLMTIYGSNERFIEEYQLKLADILLAMVGYDTDLQVEKLEKLKSRFGESAMLKCEAMLKDMANSKRVNTHVKSRIVDVDEKTDEKRASPSTESAAPRTPRVRQTTLPFRAKKSRSGARAKAKGTAGDRKAPPSTRASPSSRPKSVVSYEKGFLDASIISLESWPKTEAEKLKLPPRVQAVADAYSDCYAEHKKPRVMRPIAGLGRVQIEVELQDRKVELTVTPAQAVCLAQFEGHNELSFSELCDAMGCGGDTARRAIGFWLREKVLREAQSEEGTIVYRVLEKLTGDEDASMTMMSLRDDEQEMDSKSRLDFHQAVPYILGIVGRHRAAPALRQIKDMLKAILNTVSTRDLDVMTNKALRYLVKERKLKIVGGRYKKCD